MGNQCHGVHGAVCTQLEVCTEPIHEIYMNTNPFVEASKPNHFYSQPFSSHSTASTILLEESTDELESCDCFGDKDLDGIFDGDDHDLLDKLSNLVDDGEEDPF